MIFDFTTPLQYIDFLQKINPIFHTTPPEQIHNTCHFNPTMI